MALTIKKPDAMHSYFPREYEFVPYDRLCYAYYQIGNFIKAYQNNESALKYNPSGNDLSRCLYNKKHLTEALENIDKINQKDGKSEVKLNIGCGGKKLNGYIDTDVVETPFTDEVFSATKIPYKDNTVASVYCEHVIEHLNHEDSLKSIKEINRILIPGGELLLYIPDLNECCKKYYEANNSKLVNGYKEKDWYKYTIYGIQKDENNVPSEFQYHKTGYSKEEIIEILEDNGFVVDYAENY